MESLPLWPFGALLFSFCGAIIIGYNHWAQVDGRTLVIARTLGVWPLAALSALVLPWPTAPAFYLTAAGMGVGLAYADTLLFNAAATHGGRLTALYIPMKMLICFVLWALIDPASLTPLLASPVRIAAIAAGFLCCGTALLFLRKADASWVALLAVLPVALLLSLGDVVAKEALGPVTTTSGWLAVIGRTVAFLTVTTTVGTLSGLLAGGTKGLSFTPSTVLKSAGFGAVLLIGLSILLLTLAIAPNPGYVAAITMLSALWLALWAHFKHGERNNLWAGLALLAGAILVALAGS